MTSWWDATTIPQWPAWGEKRGDQCVPVIDIVPGEYVTRLHGQIYLVEWEFHSVLAVGHWVIQVRHFYRHPSHPWWTYDVLALDDQTDPPTEIREIMTELPSRLMEWLL